MTSTSEHGQESGAGAELSSGEAQQLAGKVKDAVQPVPRRRGSYLEHDFVTANPDEPAAADPPMSAAADQPQAGATSTQPTPAEAAKAKKEGEKWAKFKKAVLGKVEIGPELDEIPDEEDRPDLASRAELDEDGTINVWVNLNKALGKLPKDVTSASSSVLDPLEALDCPPLNIVVFIVGSRGDVQPYLSLALKLIELHSHRVRIATHPDFRDFVLGENKKLKGKKGKHGVELEGRLEFFDTGGDPKSLMSYMVRNPGLLPAMETLKNGDVGDKRRMTAVMLDGFWESTFNPDPVSGKPFAVDAIISNPPAFAHIHIAEALGVPLMMSFTMPWTMTKYFKHPLVNIKQSNTEASAANYLSYRAADLLTWQGLGDIINAFRTTRLGLEPLNMTTGSTLLSSSGVPWTYCWSEGLIPKPKDWARNIDISGFYFLEGSTGFEPDKDLAEFLKKGEPPIYIGFGSVVVEDSKAMTETIMAAVKKAGVRALVSAGWGGLGGVDVPAEVFILQGAVPHDWLFAEGRVTAVCHHGGAGTTAIGLRNGLPTIVVPFFGDQKFWGEMIHRAGGGPEPIPQKQLTVDNLADAIKFAVSPEAKAAAGKMGEQIRSEDGEAKGVTSFHRSLPLHNMQCDVLPDHAACWRSSKYCLKLSAAVAGVLVKEGKLEYKDLGLLRTREYFSRSRRLTAGLMPTSFPFSVNMYKAFQQLAWDRPRGANTLAAAIPQNIVDAFGGLHEGFDAVPKLLGSERRERAPVTGFTSGVKEGAKGVAYGWWDGITGLVTEPIQGGKKEGFVGALKGMGRSWVNVNARPAAGIMGAMALPLHGSWQNFRQFMAGQPRHALRPSREKLSDFDAERVSLEERRSIVATWNELVSGTEERKNARKLRHKKRKDRADAAAKKLESKVNEGDADGAGEVLEQELLVEQGADDQSDTGSIGEAFDGDETSSSETEKIETPAKRERKDGAAAKQK